MSYEAHIAKTDSGYEITGVTVHAQTAAELATLIAGLSAVGIAVKVNGIQNETITTVVRRVHVDDKGTETPLLDFYPDWRGNFGQYHFCGVYLNTPEDISQFEKHSGLKLQDIPIYESQGPMKRTKGRTHRCEIRCKMPFKATKSPTTQKEIDGKLEMQYKFAGYSSADKQPETPLPQPPPPPAQQPGPRVLDKPAQPPQQKQAPGAAQGTAGKLWTDFADAQDYLKKLLDANPFVPTTAHSRLQPGSTKWSDVKLSREALKNALEQLNAQFKNGPAHAPLTIDERNTLMSNAGIDLHMDDDEFKAWWVDWERPQTLAEWKQAFIEMVQIKNPRFFVQSVKYFINGTKTRGEFQTESGLTIRAYGTRELLKTCGAEFEIQSDLQQWKPSEKGTLYTFEPVYVYWELHDDGLMEAKSVELVFEPSTFPQ